MADVVAPRSALVRLIELVHSGAITPLRGTYAVTLARAGKPLPLHSELPPKAFWTAPQLNELLMTLQERFGIMEAERRFAQLFIAVSCHWLTDDHPDPDGHHLNAVALFAHSYMAGTAPPGKEAAVTSEPTLRTEVFDLLDMKADCALLWDYAAVPECTSEERSGWGVAAQEALALWLLHPQIALWIKTDTPRGGTRGLPELASRKFDSSGWCFTERLMAEQSKPERYRLDLGNRPPLPTLAAMANNTAPAINPPFRMLAAVCPCPRGPPLLPQTFIVRLGGGLAPGSPPSGPQFPGASDRELACRMYAAAFEAAAANTATLDMHGLRWGAADVEAMLATLPHYTACAHMDVSCGTMRLARSEALALILERMSNLGALIAGGTWVGTEAAPALASALSSARSLTSLSLDAVGLQDASACQVLRALANKDGPPVQVLALRDNEMGLEACGLLTSLIATSSSLSYLDVACNQLTLGGTEHSAFVQLLSTALRRTSPLTTLLAGGNALNVEAAAAVTTALATNAVITSLDVRTSVALPAAVATKLAAAVLASSTLQHFGGVPIRSLIEGGVTSLDLAEHALGVPEAYVLGELVLGCSMLQSINVDGTELMPLSELRAEVVAVEAIDLSRGGLGPASAIMLGTLLSANTSITSLSLSHNRLDTRAVGAIADALYFQTGLTALDVSGNPIGEAGAKALTEVLSVAAPSMASLAVDGAALPVRELRGTKSTRTLKLEKMGLGPLSAIVIAGLVRSNPSLTNLSIADNHIGAKGAAAVTDAMRHAKVVSLDISSNDIGAAGARVVGMQLALSHSSLTAISVDSFSLPIKKLRGVVPDDAKPVDTLNLQKKKIGSLSGVIIGALVRTNSTLTSLNLSANALGAVGGLALAEATAFNTSLSQVDIRNNKLDAEAKVAVRAIAPQSLAGRLLVSSASSDSGDAEATDPAGRPSKGPRTSTTARPKPGATARMKKAGLAVAFGIKTKR